MTLAGLAIGSVGGLLLWSAITGQPIAPTIAAILAGEPLPTRPPSPTALGGNGGGGAGSGGGGGGGGSW